MVLLDIQHCFRNAANTTSGIPNSQMFTFFFEKSMKWNKKESIQVTRLSKFNLLLCFFDSCKHSWGVHLCYSCDAVPSWEFWVNFNRKWKNQGRIGIASSLEVNGKCPSDCSRNGKFREFLHKAQNLVMLLGWLLVFLGELRVVTFFSCPSPLHSIFPSSEVIRLP